MPSSIERAEASTQKVAIWEAEGASAADVLSIMLAALSNWCAASFFYWSTLWL